MNDRRILRWILGYARPHRWRIALLVLTTLVTAGSNVLFAWILKQFVDIAAGASALGLGLVASVAVASAVIEHVAGFVHSVTQRRVDESMRLAMQLDLFSHLSRIPMLTYNRFHTGDLNSRLTRDAELAGGLVASRVGNLFDSLVKVSFSLAYALFLSWRLSMLALLVSALIPLLAAAFSKRLAASSRAKQEKVAAWVSAVQESLQGMPVIRAFALQRSFAEKLGAAGRARVEAAVREARTHSAFGQASTFVGWGTFLVVMGVGAAYVIDGQMSVGSMLAFVQLLNWIVWPFTGLAQIWGGVQSALAAGQRLYALLEIPADAPAVPATPALPTSRKAPRIVVHDVHFAYEPGKPVLRGVSFEVEPGQVVGLVGPSGAGKTTLLMLLLGLYRCEEGTVAFDFDGFRVAAHDGAAHGGLVSYVPQESYLFSGTILENILHGHPGASEEMVVEAAKKAHAHDFIVAMEEGYRHRVGEAGRGLSGGQRQRISLARALLRPAPVLLLDEPTSSLDTESEERIRAALTGLRGERTVLIVAHRLSTLHACDKIFVLDDGVICEEGTHEELMSLGGRYVQLYRALSRSHEREDGSEASGTAAGAL